MECSFFSFSWRLGLGGAQHHQKQLCSRSSASSHLLAAARAFTTPKWDSMERPVCCCMHLVMAGNCVISCQNSRKAFSKSAHGLPAVVRAALFLLSTQANIGVLREGGLRSTSRKPSKLQTVRRCPLQVYSTDHSHDECCCCRSVT